MVLAKKSPTSSSSSSNFLHVPRNPHWKRRQTLESPTTIGIPSGLKDNQNKGEFRAAGTSSPSPSPNELVSAKLLFEARKSILQKEEEIEVLQARITHLERLSDLKDTRIEQLNLRLDQLSQELFKRHNASWNGLLHQNSLDTPGDDPTQPPDGRNSSVV